MLRLFGDYEEVAVEELRHHQQEARERRSFRNREARGAAGWWRPAEHGERGEIALHYQGCAARRVAGQPTDRGEHGGEGQHHAGACQRARSGRRACRAARQTWRRGPRPTRAGRGVRWPALPERPGARDFDARVAPVERAGAAAPLIQRDVVHRRPTAFDRSPRRAPPTRPGPPVPRRPGRPAGAQPGSLVVLERGRNQAAGVEEMPV